MIVLAALRTELCFVRGPQACVGLQAQRWPEVSARLRRRPPAAALVVGFSGGLRAQLTPGTLILASSVRGTGGHHPSPEMLARAQHALPEAEVGPICTAEELAPPEQKARLGLDSLAVDLESERLVQGLEELSVPWLAVRVVLDALWEKVPQRAARVAWAGRGLACARRLGEAARRLAPALAEGAR